MYQYKIEPLFNEDVNRLLNACKTPLEKVIIYTLVDTGMRVSELCRLNKQDIDWQNKLILIHGKGAKKRGAKKRVVPMTERVYTILSAWFTLNDSIKMTTRNLRYIVKKVAKRAGITRKVSPHVLRHTFSIKCLDNQIDIRDLQDLLGHNSITTTAIYLNTYPIRAIKNFRDKFH